MSKSHETWAREVTSTLSTDHVLCRFARHQWDWKGFAIVGGAIESTMYCDRCGAARTEVFSRRTFETLSSSYRYPAGYTLKKRPPVKGDRLHRSDIVGEVWKRNQSRDRKR